MDHDKGFIVKKNYRLRKLNIERNLSFQVYTYSYQTDPPTAIYLNIGYSKKFGNFLEFFPADKRGIPYRGKSIFYNSVYDSFHRRSDESHRSEEPFIETTFLDLSLTLLQLVTVLEEHKIFIPISVFQVLKIFSEGNDPAGMHGYKIRLNDRDKFICKNFFLQKGRVVDSHELNSNNMSEADLEVVKRMYEDKSTDNDNIVYRAYRGEVHDVSQIAYEKFKLDFSRYYLPTRRLFNRESYWDPLEEKNVDAYQRQIWIEQPTNLVLKNKYFLLKKVESGVTFNLTALSYLCDLPIKVKITIGYSRHNHHFVCQKFFMDIEPANEEHKSFFIKYFDLKNGLYSSRFTPESRIIGDEYPSHALMLYIHILEKFKIYLPIGIFEVLQDHNIIGGDTLDSYKGMAKDISEEARFKYQDAFNDYYNECRSFIVALPYVDPLVERRLVNSKPCASSNKKKEQTAELVTDDSKALYANKALINPNHFLNTYNKNILGIKFKFFTYSYMRHIPIKIKILMGYDRHLGPFMDIEPANDDASVYSGDLFYSEDADTYRTYPYLRYYINILKRYHIFIPISIFEALLDDELCDLDAAGGYFIQVIDVSQKAFVEYGINMDDYYQPFLDLLNGSEYVDPLDHPKKREILYSIDKPIQDKKENNRHRLLLGEQNFSFTKALCDKHASKKLFPKRIIATEYMSEQAILENKNIAVKYKTNTDALRKLGAEIKLGVDARKIHTTFPNHRFRYIHFNGPNNDPDYHKRILANMVGDFFKSAAKLQEIGDKIYLGLLSPRDNKLERVCLHLLSDQPMLSQITQDGSIILIKQRHSISIHFVVGKIFKKGREGSLEMQMPHEWGELLLNKWPKPGEVTRIQGGKDRQIDQVINQLLDIGNHYNLIVPMEHWYAGYVYKAYDAAASAGYRLYKKRQFGSKRYPGYDHEKTGKSISTKNAQSMREFVFIKIEPEINLPDIIRYKSPSKEIQFHEGADYADSGHIFPEMDTENDSSDSDDEFMNHFSETDSQRNKDDDDEIFKCIASKNHALLRYHLHPLLAENCFPIHYDLGFSPLHYAAAHDGVISCLIVLLKKLETIRDINEYQKILDYQDKYGNSALTIAIRGMNLVAAELLLRAGAMIDPSSETYLQQVSYYQFKELVDVYSAYRLSKLFPEKSETNAEFMERIGRYFDEQAKPSTDSTASQPSDDLYKKARDRRQFIVAKFSFIKPQPIIDNEETEHALSVQTARVQASSFGFSVKEMPGDGNCLYHAISDQLTIEGIYISGPALRRISMQQMKNFPDKYAEFLTGPQYFGLRHLSKDALNRARLEIRKNAMIYNALMKHGNKITYKREDILEFLSHTERESKKHSPKNTAVHQLLETIELSAKEKIDAHVKAMLENGALKFADDIDIQAMSDALGISIAIIQPNPSNTFPIVYRSQGAQARKIFILYENGDHYNSLRGYPDPGSQQELALVSYLDEADVQSVNWSKQKLNNLGRAPLDQVASIFSADIGQVILPDHKRDAKESETRVDISPVDTELPSMARSRSSFHNQSTRHRHRLRHNRAVNVREQPAFRPGRGGNKK